jgi:hypothetical protein
VKKEENKSKILIVLWEKRNYDIYGFKHSNESRIKKNNSMAKKKYTKMDIKNKLFYGLINYAF